MSFNIASASSKNNSVQIKSANRNQTPENFSEEAVANENENGNEDGEVKAASVQKSSETSRHFPTFRSALSAETMQTLMRMYAR